MTLLSMMTATATTERHPAMAAGKRGAPTTHLEDVKITPVMLSDAMGMHRIRAAIGLDGTAVQVFEAYTQSHEHTDNDDTVTQMPDIIAGDRVVVGSVEYVVHWAEQQPAGASMPATLLLYMSEDKRA